MVALLRARGMLAATMSFDEGPDVGAELSLGAERLGSGSRSVTLEGHVAELFEQLRDGIYRYLLTILHDRAEAEETAQETFLRLHRHLQTGQSVHNVKPWLFRVAHNLALDREKARVRTATNAPITVDELLASLLDPAPNPEEQLLRKELIGNLHSAISRLSRQQQQCLHLRTEGFRYREIAEIVGVSESTVCECLRRGITRLMKDFHG